MNEWNEYYACSKLLEETFDNIQKALPYIAEMLRSPIGFVAQEATEDSKRMLEIKCVYSDEKDKRIKSALNQKKIIGPGFENALDFEISNGDLLIFFGSTLKELGEDFLQLCDNNLKSLMMGKLVLNEATFVVAVGNASSTSAKGIPYISNDFYLLDSMLSYLKMKLQKEDISSWDKLYRRAILLYSAKRLENGVVKGGEIGRWEKLCGQWIKAEREGSRRSIQKASEDLLRAWGRNRPNFIEYKEKSIEYDHVLASYIDSSTSIQRHPSEPKKSAKESEIEKDYGDGDEFQRAIELMKEIGKPFGIEQQVSSQSSDEEKADDKLKKQLEYLESVFKNLWEIFIKNEQPESTKIFWGSDESGTAAENAIRIFWGPNGRKTDDKLIKVLPETCAAILRAMLWFGRIVKKYERRLENETDECKKAWLFRLEWGNISLL